ncbi:aspartate aminotransferase family protein [Xanthobacter sp. KR7-65]|uniref:aspartate aminotransferase family protein n=1 Tax=Xanthobacter sp. KR7-65 TaxID=3156612 RepID=UPI0032B43FB8
MTDQSNSLHVRDIANLLHPNTNARRHEAQGPMIITRGEGIHVYDDQGKAYIEGLAGLWSVALGFGEKRLVEAAARQMQALPYYHTFSHKSNAPAIELAERLVEMTPEGLTKVFFTNSGSEANDTVVKMIWYYNNALGRPAKKKIISRARAYHGITIIAGSMTGLPMNQRDFDLPLPGFLHLTCPHHYRNALPGESEEAFATRLAEELEAMILREGPETVAAFIGEPVMAAGGVMPPPDTYWTKIQAVCRRHDVLVVADEVINGFGRLGTPFGCDRYGITPDFMVLSKQLTSSYMPLSAIVLSDQVYQVIADNSDRIGAFGHGFTATGHPVATAVALENLRIIEERDLIAHAAAVAPALQDGLRSRFAGHPLVGEVRGVGLIAGVELVADKARKTKFDPPGQVAAYLHARAQEHGLILRAIEDTLAFCPPLIITEAEIGMILDRFGAALDDTSAWVKTRAAPAA